MRSVFVPAVVALACLADVKAPQAALSVTYPVYIVGNSSSTAVTHQRSDGAVSGFKVTVKDQSGAPVSQAFVRLNFAGAVGNGTLSLYSSQPAGQTLNCSSFTVENYTDSNGDATFNVKFGGRTGNGQYEKMQLYVAKGSDQFETWLPGISTDFDQSGSTGLSDLANYSSAYLDPNYYSDYDFDHDNVTTGDLGDYAIFSESMLHTCNCSLCPR